MDLYKIAEEFVDERLNQARDAIRKSLTPGLQESGAKRVIGKYRAAIEPNFIQWMVKANETASDSLTKSYLSRNIQAEIDEDHPGMLRAFTNSAGVNLAQHHYDAVSDPVSDMWSIFKEEEGLQNVAAVATLENTSPIFIPYLESLAKSLGSNDLTYTQAHGVADIEHANQLRQGLIHEIKISKDRKADEIVEETIARTTRFLEEILGAEL